MTSIKSLAALVLVTVCFASCGSTREVKYVYVNPPQQTVIPQSYVHASKDAPTAYTATSHTSNASTQSCSEVSIEHASGVFRGYGQGRSSSLTAARNMAIQRAKVDILKKATGVLDALTDDDIDSNNAAACERFRETSKERLRGILRNTKIVCSNIQEGGVNEVRLCLEVSSRDIISLIDPIIKELEADSQVKIQEKLKKGQM